MTSSPNLDQMTPEQLRALAAQALQLQSQVEAMSRKIQNDETIIEQLTYEIALLKRHKFAKRSEQLSRHKAAHWMTCSIQTLKLSKPS
ncbi:hypothetical protein ABH909_002196 [Pseudomonas sp. BS3782 TE3695]|uniref:transposase domain-containing protein n=1 Tax=Pseudomonas sp. BS3782 TE3695 TaxID=3349323 RepID=UPI003D2296B3